MEFRTVITIPKSRSGFSYEDQCMLLGSCFVENIGNKLEENKFTVDINPFGTLYNPLSIATSITRLLHPESFSSGDLFHHGGVYHSFAHHSRFSFPSEEESLSAMNRRLFVSSGNLLNATRLIITFGTAFVYRLKSDNRLVSNCHKLPEQLFIRELLTVEEIVKEWKEVLLAIWEQNPALEVLFTVSPIRHWKDGAHANQISKSTLLLASEEIRKLYPGKISYFPAYEIVMDELRDYRFYADDMIHPSGKAIAYIWERFMESYFSPETKSLLKEWQNIQKALNHKPFHPESEAYQSFITQTLLKAEQIMEKFPYFQLSEEIELLRTKLN
ncbi:MAG: GSCFA domain-containing protein [Tannerellaceae bacterium]|nr:GSCFA domain-containing protein [Tannerellaceae bacterium]